MRKKKKKGGEKKILAFKFLSWADTTTTGRRAIFTGVRKHRK